MAEDIIMAEDTTSSNTAQQLATTQPNSRLHALPQELKEMIFAFAVVSPTPIPARVHLKDIEESSTDSSSSPSSNDDTTSCSSDSISTPTFKTLVKIDPTQPALSCIDSETRPTVLRIFYTQNTFLFRAHAYVEGPLRKWLDATEHNYAPEARMIRRVLLEMSVAKTCGAQQSQFLQPLVVSRRGTPDLPRHLYRVQISQQSNTSPSPEGVRLRFGADLAVMCSCAMRTAGLLKPTPRARRGIFFEEESATSSALAFAYDVEYDIVLTNECKYHFCDARSSSTCRDCGLRVHRGEPLGEHLLERVRRDARAEAEMKAAMEASRLAREKERAEREAARLEREAARLEREREREEEQAEREAAREESESEAAEAHARIQALLAEDPAERQAEWAAMREQQQRLMNPPRQGSGCAVM